ncbi:ATP-dependent helicase HrpB [Thiospirochaeta perfilievii]|uniref:ATP-dependent helicase HrpB n=1 Tax=Thiospirochaeta perfilievii TaxID=252967 RepID=A0A5C1Q946_9SPIO|nr:ATP-dependent helicase HrpB [Thiospirochaeta perfilievii]QEN03429.1 ATP-dependent helicase HrpB [Thiospirochaeta perfilievii]
MLEVEINYSNVKSPLNSVEYLPIYSVITNIKLALNTSSSCVIKAATGAGKSSVVPLELLGEDWIKDRKIILVEPRRIAARSVANWMAKTLGESIGQSVGYRVHLDTKVSESTIVEVVTEGVFVNKLLSDPELLDTACVIFDEFHERSVDLDLSLSLLKECQEVVRDDLKLIIMSATIDTSQISLYLDNAPIIESEGRSYPVDILYEPGTNSDLLSYSFYSDLLLAVVNSVIDVINNYQGSILVFLPGVGEIKRVLTLLSNKLPSDILVLPLYSGLSREDQELAIAPSDSTRKVVLSTSIAESSITIDGVNIVIDSGLIRRPTFNSKNGMESLETIFVSQASADQRAGRAGRTKPGVCIRLWDSHKKLQKVIEPGILREDLTPTVLNLAAWGYVDLSSLNWLTPPNVSLFNNALDLLVSLGCINDSGITAKGRTVRSLPVHPRLGSMVYEAKKVDMLHTATFVAAILSEKDFINYPNRLSQSDIFYRLEACLNRSVYPGTINKYGLKRVKDYANSMHSGNTVSFNTSSLGKLLMYAYPDRVAKSIGEGRFITINGVEVSLLDHDTLYNCPYIIVLNSGGTNRINKVYLAHEITTSDLYDRFKTTMEWSSELIYDKNRSMFRLHKEYKLGAIVLKSETLNKIPTDLYQSLLISYLSKNGLSTLNWDKKCNSFVDRVNFLNRIDKDKFPDFSSTALIADLNWLKPFITSGGIDLLSALKGLLGWDRLKLIDELAPTHIVVPSGSNIPLDYSTGEVILKVRLQELFGLTVTPVVYNNQVPITIHLLSPASRPIQITKDLKSFWDNTYIDVKKDLKGRYPKHHWPDNPYQATPTNRVKGKGKKQRH